MDGVRDLPVLLDGVSSRSKNSVKMRVIRPDLAVARGFWGTFATVIEYPQVRLAGFGLTRPTPARRIVGTTSQASPAAYEMHESLLVAGFIECFRRNQRRRKHK